MLCCSRPYRFHRTQRRKPKRTEVKLPEPSATRPYVWGDRMLAFHRCRSCGIVTHWQSLDGTRDRMAINARLIDGLDWEKIRVRQFDGAATWAYVDDEV